MNRDSESLTCVGVSPRETCNGARSSLILQDGRTEQTVSDVFLIACKVDGHRATVADAKPD